MSILNQLPDSFLQASSIFLSIVIEALPFVLFGSLLSGFLEVYLTPELVNKYLPKQKILRIFFGTFVGFFFPSCECGIVPIVNRFLEKKVPSYTAIPFLSTAPIINPIVLFATFSAFSNSWKFVFLRALGAIIVSIVLGIFLGFILNDDIVKNMPSHNHDEEKIKQLSVGKKVWHALTHSIDEFFDTGRYLIFGSLCASAMQVYIPTRVISTISANPLIAILLLMLLAFLLSLCSEADAFIGSSLLATFGTAPVLAFLIVGPMIDIKNMLMMKHYFKTRFILQFVAIVVVVIVLYSIGIGVII